MAMWSSTLMTCMFIDLIFKWSVPHLLATLPDAPPAYTEEEIDRLGYTPILPSSFLYRSAALLVLLGPVPTARIVLGDASFPEMVAGFSQGMVLGLVLQVLFASVFKVYGAFFWKNVLIPVYRCGLFGRSQVSSLDGGGGADADEEEQTLLGGRLVDARIKQRPLVRSLQCCNRQLSKVPGLEFLDARADVIVEDLDKQTKVLEKKIKDMLFIPPDSWTCGIGNNFHKLVPAPEMESKIRDMLLYTLHVGGCSGADGDSTWVRNIKSMKISRLEHPMLWTEYASRKMTMKQQMRTYKVKIPPIKPAVEGHETLDSSVNEVYLWHGTGPDHLDDILRWGLDERVCSINGLYGAGLYFASDICKGGQYSRPAGPSGNTRYFFYTRVLLGLPYYPSGDTQGARRPPPFSEKSGKLYDSVIANVGQANKGRQFHREFVVYDRRQTYAEFLIEATV
eukprot:TRINITY_DN56879_c0_g1_i1.p1 TRINITY_DN56879_c0_g1~~TRINITY_DN56879_c0_g1_i1.p1  ORF type:complete len:511 (+),score=53.97 TRINITY_DN56879_c0_g1_i1:182-1534(+)